MIMTMTENTSAPLTLRRQTADRRICRRLQLDAVRRVVIVQRVDAPAGALAGHLVDLSGGGCCLLAVARTAEDLKPGDHCTVRLPVPGQELRYPATLVSVDAPTGGDRVRIRLRFRKADPIARQRLIRWIGDLAIESWHTS